MAFPSSDLLQSDGLEVFARRNKDEAHSDCLPGVLLSHLPADPRGFGAISIQDLVSRHRGEVRELSGSGYWFPWEGKEPARATHQQLKDLIMWKEVLASGGAASGGTTRPQVRVAKVFGLMDLFVALGHGFTAEKLYEVYLSCPLIARRRLRGCTSLQ